MHAVPTLGAGQLEEWARAETDGTGLGWRELAAGAASSVLVLHALIAAAADPRATPEHAAQIAATYLSTCVLLTLLDGLVDYERDANHDGSHALSYLGLYENREGLSEVLRRTARRAASHARALPSGGHHVMILVGVVAYYSSAPGAESELAGPAIAQLRRELAPLVSPTRAIMRAWRGARQLRARADGARAGARS
jgi:hypothetical protein